MTKCWMLALACIVAQDRKQEKEPVLWSGSVEAGQADAFPKGRTKRSVRFGLIDSGEAWAKCWKRLDEAAPKVDFQKNLILFICYEKWPGKMNVGEPVLKDGVLTVDVSLDCEGEKRRGKGGMHYVPARCHYDYSCRALSRADLKTIKITCDEKELGEIVLAKAK